MEQIEAAIQHGPHKLALDPEAIALIVEDLAYQVQAGIYVQVVEWETLQRRLPPQLKVLPLAVVPQLNCRGCMILDLLFPVLQQAKGKGSKQKREVCKMIQELVNDTTIRIAPDAPSRNSGTCYHGCCFMQEVPPEEDIHFAKIDLADGYWRMIVEEAN
jgi:hypothetical protein